MNFKIRVKLYSAGVRIVVDPGAEPSVEWENQPAGARIETSDAGVRVREQKTFGTGGTPGEVIITIPVDTAQMELSVAQGDVDIAARGVDSKVKTGAGNITGTAFVDSEVKTGAGDVKIEEVEGSDVKSGTGDIHIERVMVTKKCELKTGVGSINVAAVTGAEPPKSLKVKSGTGDVRVGIVEGTAAKLEVKTGLGQVKSELDEVASVAEVTSKVFLEAKSGVGDVTIVRA